ncbi:MAG TPA: amine dehydrogenase large subunit [Candidatus Binatia bacterium]|nr:amine dehydrogenase large subunit [Candidatus Binatia bacterium]
MPRAAIIAAAIALAAAISVAPARAEPEPETVGAVVTLPESPAPHWFWQSDTLLKRTALFDGDSGRMLGTINSGSAGVGFVIFPVFSPDHREIYIAESYYSRGVRGDRTDVVTVYDGRSLAPLAEIGIPPRRAEYFPGNAASALSDDGRFMAVFNLTPLTSLSIVDVKSRTFTAEVPTPGCSLVFAAGPRRFFMLCANGAALTVSLDEAGGAPKVERTAPFFKPIEDPITEKAVRRGNEWLFVSFAGVIHPVDVSGPQLAFGEPWPLLDDADRQGNWRVGGLQHLAVHSASGRLYVLMHQGGPDTHKDPGTEVWVYDLANHRRLQQLSVVNPLVSFIALQSAIDPSTTSGSLSRWALEKSLPNPGVERIVVTQDANPVLLAGSSMPPSITVHDAMTGEMLREISEPGLAGTLMFTP